MILILIFSSQIIFHHFPFYVSFISFIPSKKHTYQTNQYINIIPFQIFVSIDFHPFVMIPIHFISSHHHNCFSIHFIFSLPSSITTTNNNPIPRNYLKKAWSGTINKTLAYHKKTLYYLLILYLLMNNYIIGNYHL